MHTSDLIAFRRAEASGHIIYDYKNETSYCPTAMDCNSCTFYNQCDNDSYFGYGSDNTYIDGWVRVFQKMPEFNLTSEELQTLYPEYYI